VLTPNQPTKTKQTKLKLTIKRIEIEIEGDEQAIGDLAAAYLNGLEDGRRGERMLKNIFDSLKPGKPTASNGQTTSPPTASASPEPRDPIPTAKTG
jgi:hypothetical protein